MSVSCIVQYKQLSICTVESTVFVQLGPSPFCQPNNVHAKYTYSQINASLRDVRSNGQNGVRLTLFGPGVFTYYEYRIKLDSVSESVSMSFIYLSPKSRSKKK